MNRVGSFEAFGIWRLETEFVATSKDAPSSTAKSP